MKKPFNKIFMIILSVTMVFFIGCDFGEKTGEETLLETSESLSVVNEDLPQVDINLGLLTNAYSQESSISPEFSAQVNEMLAILNQKALDDGINVTVKIKWLPSAYSIELTDQNEYRCDVYLTGRDKAKELFDEGYILQLNDLIKKHAPEYYSFFKTDKLVASVSDIGDIDNEPLYILPTNRIGSDAQVVMMEKAIAEKYNISISNISDYVEAMRKIKAGGEIKIPGHFTPEFCR